MQEQLPSESVTQPMALNGSVSMAEQTYLRIVLAQEQLDLALELFLSGRSYVSVITLAGAAEEIFGKTLSALGEETVLESEHSVVAPIEEIFQKKPYLWKDFTTKKNRVRNAAKHMRNLSESEIVADLEDESLWMLIRAYENCNRLGLPKTDRMKNFDDWFDEHVIGYQNFN